MRPARAGARPDRRSSRNTGAAGRGVGRDEGRPAILRPDRHRPVAGPPTYSAGINRFFELTRQTSSKAHHLAGPTQMGAGS